VALFFFDTLVAVQNPLAAALRERSEQIGNLIGGDAYAGEEMANRITWLAGDVLRDLNVQLGQQGAAGDLNPIHAAVWLDMAGPALALALAVEIIATIQQEQAEAADADLVVV
jgi:hypothetical protein